MIANKDIRKSLLSHTAGGRVKLAHSFQIVWQATFKCTEKEVHAIRSRDLS